MRDYELMIVFDPALDEAGLEAAVTRVTTLVTQRGGAVKNVDGWGRRRLAYPIGRARDGVYMLFHLALNASVAAELERGLGLMEPAMRHLITRASETAPARTAPQGPEISAVSPRPAPRAPEISAAPGLVAPPA